MAASPWLCKHCKWRTSSSHTMLCFSQTFMFLLQHLAPCACPLKTTWSLPKGYVMWWKSEGWKFNTIWGLWSLDWMKYIHLSYYLISEPDYQKVDPNLLTNSKHFYGHHNYILFVATGEKFFAYGCTGLSSWGTKYSPHDTKWHQPGQPCDNRLNFANFPLFHDTRNPCSFVQCREPFMSHQLPHK